MKNFGLLILTVCLFAGCGEKLKVEKNLDPELEKAKRSFAADASKPKTEKEKLLEAAAKAEPKIAEPEVADPETEVAKAETVVERGADSKTETPNNETAEAKVDARTVLSDAITTAKSEGKAVFVHFTADW